MHLITVRLLCAVAAMLPVSLAAQGRAGPADSTSISSSESALASTERLAWVPATGSSVAPLQRRIAVDLRGATVREALDAVAREGGLLIGYSADAARARGSVSLHVEGMPVRDALARVLEGTPFAAYVSLNGRQILVRRPFPEPAVMTYRQAGGSLMGRVSDAVTHAPLDQVAVHIEGRALGAVTGSDGRYAVRNIPSGTYRVTARRVGYTPLTTIATVTADSATTADFALAAAATKLNEVVTTAVGDQRRYEVGNTISTINADSIVPTTPITSLTDLISARAPGVEVLETGGMVGSGETIRIRGLSSLVLQNDPILIVDGVRQDNSAGGDLGGYFSVGFSGSNGTHPTPIRLNDIDFNDIASIDILKGPSASTEYGTDAANGVIVLTTKHGTAGRSQWRVSAEQTASGIPERFPDGYYSWGHTTDGTNTAVDCPLVVGEGISSGYARTAGNCVVDSVTRWNPLNHAATSIFGTGTRGKYDLSVSGGSDAVRYFVSGGLANEAGIVRMPSVFRELADTAHLGLPSAALNPNSQQQRSVRVNTAITLGPTADLTATGGYLSTYQQTPETQGLLSAVIFSPALRDAAHYYGYAIFGSYIGGTPLGNLTSLGFQNTNRVTGGLSANWRPAAWLLGHATFGLDHGSQRNEVLNYPLANATFQSFGSFLGIIGATTDVYTVDLRGTATASLARGLRAVTSGGMQLVDTRMAGQAASAPNITPTNLTLNGSTGATVGQLANRQATLGGYGEEQLSVADRLFLTGALRIDAGSGFGGAYATAAYPKASISWLALNEGRTTLRLRGAFGESGVQPLSGAAATLYAPNVAFLGGTNVGTYAFNWPGNVNLRPERSTEFEGGVDVGGWGNRVSLEVTGYAKTTRDALVNVNLGETVGNYLYQENIGKVRNTGLEGSLTVGVVQSRSLTWDVTANGSVNHNTLLSLAPGVTAQSVFSPFFNYRQAKGYPLYGLWLQRVTYADANHDGIIEPSEVRLADSASYVGPSLPTREASASTRVGLWRGMVTVGALVDYRGGYRIAHAQAANADFTGNTQGSNDPTAPLWLQARAVEGAVFAFPSSYAEDGSFVRVREVSVTYTVPHRVARALRMQNVSLTGAVRNLALWTRYTGVDPEASNTDGATVQHSPSGGGFIVNNDVRLDFGSVPLLRYWVLRLNAGF